MPDTRHCKCTTGLANLDGSLTECPVDKWKLQGEKKSISLHYKVLNKLGAEEEPHLGIINSVYGKQEANVTLSGKELEASF